MEREPSSFRDPSGYVFTEGGQLFRHVDVRYAENYDLLLSSGLYAALAERDWMVRHEEAEGPDTGRHRTLKPERLPFISYPYEWSFNQLKDAALLTLDVQELALRHGMGLKDASAYNIQFLGGRPLLIDTLSFERYQEGSPWVAYRQFCQQFLAPLALMSRADIRLGGLSRLDVDGIPLDLASRMLPKRTKLSLGLGAHLHLHASGGRAAAKRPGADARATLPKAQLLGIVSSLKSTVRGLTPYRQPTVWHGYYDNTNYQEPARIHKEELVAGWIKQVAPMSVWDAGANDARFSRLASARGILTLATDIDPYAVDDAYLEAKRAGDTALLPLVIDLANPSPALGWANRERRSFLERLDVDLILSLALVHHLAIQYGLPVEKIAELFAKTGRWLIVEFVPKRDSKVRQLLSTRQDIFDGYNETGFETAFSQYFTIKEQVSIRESERTLYLMERRQFHT